MVKAILSQFEEHDRRIFWLFASFLFISLFIYLYFLSISVFAVVARKSAELDSEKISANISVLESQYAILDKGIDLTLAHKLGFVDSPIPTYVSSVSDNKTFSLRTGVAPQE